MSNLMMPPADPFAKREALLRGGVFSAASVGFFFLAFAPWMAFSSMASAQVLRISAHKKTYSLHSFLRVACPPFHPTTNPSSTTKSASMKSVSLPSPHQLEGRDASFLPDARLFLSVKDAIQKMGMREGQRMQGGRCWGRLEIERAVTKEAEGLRWSLEIRVLLKESWQVYWKDKRGTLQPLGISLFDATTKGYLFALPRSQEKITLYFSIPKEPILPWVLENITLRTAQSFFWANDLELLGQGMYFGFLFAMILFNLFLYASEREKSFLAYVFFQISVGGYFLVTGSLAYRFFISAANDGFFLSKYGNFFLACIVFGNAWFGRAFLETRRFSLVADRLLFSLMGMGGVYALLSLSPVSLQHFGEVNRLLGLISPFLIISAGLLVWRRGARAARYYLLGQSVFTLSAAAFVILALEPVAGASAWGIYTFQAGSMFEAALFSLALVDRLRILRRLRVRLEQEKQEAEAKAQEQKRRLQLTLDATKNGIWDWKINDEALYLSPSYAAMLGYEEGQWEETLAGWMALVHEQDREVVRASLEAYAAQPKPQENHQMEFRFKDKSGRWRWIFAQSTFLETEASEGAKRLVGIHADITTRKQAQAQMARAEKMAALGKLMAGIAHEINNPTNFLAFNLPLLRQSIEAIEPILETYCEEHPQAQIMYLPPAQFLEETYQLIEDMRYGASRIHTLIGELRGFVRSHESLVKRPESVSLVVEHLRMLVQKQLQTMRTRLEIEVEEGLPKAVMHAGKIEQVLINLLINAAQAAEKEDAWVRLRIQRDPADPSILWWIVEDNGRGIAPQDLERIFDPFYTTKGEEGGTGLGLAISHEIIREHGGSIEVESQLGEGTRFRILLPLAGE